MATIYVLTGPSFSGKSTIANHLGYPKLVTSTTRHPRPGEVQGVHYNFLSRNQFLSGIEGGFFIEYAPYDGNLYGTSVDSVKSSLSKSKIVLNVMEIEGTMKLKRLYPDEVTTIFLSAELDTLIARAKERDANPEEIKSRIQKLKEELSKAYLCDVSIKNEDMDKTLQIIRWMMEERI